MKYNNKFNFLISLLIIIFNYSNVNASEQATKLDKLFLKLQTEKKINVAFEIEEKIWKIWTTHPSKNELTELMQYGSRLMNEEKLIEAIQVFSEIIRLDPSWAEGWNKRATVFYLQKNYEKSQQDINKVIDLEVRHFGALSGQGLVQIELENYESAMKSYKKVLKIYPSNVSAKIMIEQLKELIKEKTI